METFASLPRLGFEEQFRLTKLNESAGSSGTAAQRFLSQTPAWWPGLALPYHTLPKPARSTIVQAGRGAYGGHVLVQASWAAAKVVESESKESASDNGGKHIVVSMVPRLIFQIRR